MQFKIIRNILRTHNTRAEREIVRNFHIDKNLACDRIQSYELIDTVSHIFDGENVFSLSCVFDGFVYEQLNYSAQSNVICAVMNNLILERTLPMDQCELEKEKQSAPHSCCPTNGPWKFNSRAAKETTNKNE